MPRIARLDLYVVNVTTKTQWTFVELTDTVGKTGVGEASLLGREASVTAAFDHIAPTFLGRAAAPETTGAGPIPNEIAAAAVWSSIDQALWDIDAKRKNSPLADLLGRKRQSVRTYANVNRRTISRTPAAFAESATLAASHGFPAIKMAPFDEVHPTNASLKTAQPGLDRIKAVRKALPNAVQVYVDCHWRFTPEVALQMVAALADAGATWFECPIAETDDAGPPLARLRAAANACQITLAGREEGVTRAPFALYAEAGAYDVMMPDVKYIGGIQEMLMTATLLDAANVRFSPHNHTGPIGHLASLACALAADGCDLLEMQFDETPLFAELVVGKLPTLQAGCLSAPTAPGLGCALNHDVLQRHVSVHRTSGTT